MLGIYNQGLNLSTNCTSLRVETPMLILWPLLQPLRCTACLGLFLLKTCAILMRSRKRWSKFIKLEWDPAGWTLLCYSLRKISCLRGSPRLTKCKKRLLSFDYPRTKSYTSALFLGHICYAFFPRTKSCTTALNAL